MNEFECYRYYYYLRAPVRNDKGPLTGSLFMRVEYQQWHVNLIHRIICFRLQITRARITVIGIFTFNKMHIF